MKLTKSRVADLVRVLLLLLAGAAYLPNGATASPHERQLVVDLLQYYNTVARPTADHYQPVFVKVHIYLQKIIQMDPNAGELTTQMWLSLRWRDVNLVWDPLRYNNQSTIRLPSSKLWQPDIRFYNGISEETEPTQATVFSTGQVKLVSPVTLKTRCGGSTEGLGRWFPFDDYSCSLVLGTWAFHGGSVDLHWQEENEDKPSLNGDIAIDTGDWQLIGNYVSRAEPQLSCCPEARTSIKVPLRLRRRALRHLLSLHLPLLWMLGLASSTFLVPNDRTDLRLIAGALLMMGVCWWPSGQHLPFNVISVGHLFVGLVALGVSICFISHCLQLVLLSPISSGRTQTPLAGHLNRLLTTSTALKLACISDNRPEHDKDGLPDCSRVLDRLSLLLAAGIACLALLTCWILPCMLP